MTLGLAVLIVVFVALLALDTPIAFVIGIATVWSRHGRWDTAT